MRVRLFAALLFAATAATGACAPRAQPYRFAMPMLGQADVPAEALRPAGGRIGARSDAELASRARTGQGEGRHPDAPRTRYAYGWQKDAQSGIRIELTEGLELQQPEASDDAALAVTQRGLAHDIVTRGVLAARLPAPNVSASGAARSDSSAATVAAAVELPRMEPIREPAGLRALVGTRDKREPFAIAMGWLAELGVTFVEPGSAIDMATALANKPADGPALVAWAAAHGSLFGPTETPVAGDVLVFDRATSNSEADLIAIVIGRDSRGVIEMMYAGGGVIRRGFVDPAHPSTRRDFSGVVMNTFLRHGKQWPPKGTRYLSGELLAHVIRTRP